MNNKKVKINLETCQAGNQKRLNWIKEHCNEIFTAEKYHSTVGTCYSLKEDETRPKWLFFKENLIEIEEE